MRRSDWKRWLRWWRSGSGAREKLRAGTLDESDLDFLQAKARAAESRCSRQRLLYMYAREPFPTSEVIAWALHPGFAGEAAAGERPCPTVLAAIEDGWQAVHFPQQLGPGDDRETDLAGFEFILQRRENVHE